MKQRMWRRYAAAAGAAVAAALFAGPPAPAATYTLKVISATRPGHTIAVTNGDGSGLQVVGVGDASFLSFNGRYDALFSDGAVAPMHVVTLNGTTPTHSVQLPCTEFLGWAPDGHHFGCGTATPRRFFIGDAVTGRVAPLPAGIEFCAWRRGSRALICSAFVDLAHGQTVTLVSVATRRVTRVIARNVLGSSVSPTVSRLLYETVGKRALKVVNLSTFRTQTIRRSGTFSAQFSPDSKQVAFSYGGVDVLNPTGRRIAIATLATGRVRKLLPGVQADDAVFYPGRRLVVTLPKYYGLGNVVDNVGIVRTDGTGFRRLTHAGKLPFGQFGFHVRAWSLDGLHLAIEATGLHSAIAYAVKPTGGGLRVLAQGNLRIALVSPDGRFAYGSTNSHDDAFAPPDAFSVVRVPWTAGAKPTVLIPQANRPSFAFSFKP